MVHDVIREGRLSGIRSGEVAAFLSSRDADRWIAEADVQVDIAHLLMLHRQGIIEQEPAAAVMEVLLRFSVEGVPDEAFDEQFEDIHAGIESLLIAEVGIEQGGRLHIGRSRNDEVATCLRLRLCEELLKIGDAVNGLCEVLVSLAEEHTHSVMPGFTHLQHAQPTTLAHHLLSYAQAFNRDLERLLSTYQRVNRSPLGAAAFASTGYPIDREFTATMLGFSGMLENSMDAVSTRDFALEALADCAILMVNASRFCEELILWSSSLVRFVQLDDAYCSTSSIMPQKKNPDTLEIMRARAGSVIGASTAALSIVKALPMSYNRDLQQLTPHLWQGVGDAGASIRILAGALSTATFNTERMEAEAGRGFSTATELADMLVRECGLPFRTAHHIVGRAVRSGSLTLASLQKAATSESIDLSSLGLTEEQVRAALDPVHGIEARSVIGGPAVSAVSNAIDTLHLAIRAGRTAIATERYQRTTAITTLINEARRLKTYHQ